MSGGVCAVVVTHNRKDLLRECLGGIEDQTRPVDNLLVVDNASTDGTLGLVRQRFPGAELLRLSDNEGPAAGFYEGIGRAADNTYEWIWVMDDDTVPSPSALEELLSAYRRFPRGSRPSLLCSKPLWVDGELATRGFPIPRRDKHQQVVRAATRGCVAVRMAAWQSVMFRSEMVARYGRPVRSYFIFGEDTEYTARLLRWEFGVMVPTSEVVHKTPHKENKGRLAGQNYFYALRNTAWTVLYSKAFSREEKVKMVLRHLCRNVPRYLRARGFRPGAWLVVCRAVLSGLLLRP